MCSFPLVTYDFAEFRTERKFMVLLTHFLNYIDINVFAYCDIILCLIIT